MGFLLDCKKWPRSACDHLSLVVGDHHVWIIFDIWEEFFEVDVFCIFVACFHPYRGVTKWSPLSFLVSTLCGSSLTYMQANYAMPSYHQYLLGLCQCLKRRFALGFVSWELLCTLTLSHNYQVDREKNSNDIFQYEPSSNFIKKSTSFVDSCKRAPLDSL